MNGFSPDETVSVVCPDGRSGTALDTSQPVTLNWKAGAAAAIPMNSEVKRVEVSIMNGRSTGANEGGGEDLKVCQKAFKERAVDMVVSRPLYVHSYTFYLQLGKLKKSFLLDESTTQK